MKTLDLNGVRRARRVGTEESFAARVQSRLNAAKWKLPPPQRREAHAAFVNEDYARDSVTPRRAGAHDAHSLAEIEIADPDGNIPHAAQAGSDGDAGCGATA